MMSKETNSLSAIEIAPATPAKRSIIWLHGLGADGSDFVPIVPELQLPDTAGIRFIFPHAPLMPVTVNQGQTMRAWYDIHSLTIDGKIDQTGIQQSMTSVHALIERERERGVASKDIILAGFSQGAVIALSTGITYPHALGGLIALSGYLPLANDILQQASDANRAVPIFIAHGSEDMIVPYALGKAAYMTLQQAGYPITWRGYPMQHTVCAAEVNDLSQWVQEIMLIKNK